MCFITNNPNIAFRQPVMAQIGLLPILVLLLFMGNSCQPSAPSSSPSSNSEQYEATPTSNAGNATNTTENLNASCETVGLIKTNFTENDLITAYGQANVTRDSLYAEGMAIDIATYIYKNTPKELEVQWKDGATFQKIAAVRITQPNAPYTTPIGLKVGSTLQDIIKLNEAPVEFQGFGWDYGGGCCEYSKNAKLPQLMPCISFQLAIADTSFTPEIDKMINSVMGEGLKSSNEKVLEKVNVRIEQITIRL